MQRRHSRKTADIVTVVVSRGDRETGSSSLYFLSENETESRNDQNEQSRFRFSRNEISSNSYLHLGLGVIVKPIGSSLTLGHANAAYFSFDESTG